MALYTYQSNLLSTDRFDQLVILLDSGQALLLKKGETYDLSASELNRAASKVLMVPASGSAATPSKTIVLPIVGDLSNGDVPVWDTNVGSFVPGQSSTRRSGVWTPIFAGLGSSRGILSAQTSQLYYHAATNSTYFTYLGQANALMILAWRHTTDTIDDAIKVADYPATYGIEDTHGVPSMCVDDNGRIHIFYGVHNDFPYYAKSVAAGGIITGGWTIAQLGVGRGTYHTIAWDSINNRIWCLRRNGINHVAEGGTPPAAHEFGGLFYSADRGTTWTGDTAIVDMRNYSADTYEDFYHGGMRFKNVSGAARLYFDFIVAHGSAHDGPRSDLFAAYYDIAGGVVRSLDGTSRTATVTTQADIFGCRLKQSDNIGGTGWFVDSTNKFRATWLEAVRGTVTGALDQPTGFTGADGTNLNTLAWGPANAWGWAKLDALTDNLVTNGSGALYPSAGGTNAQYYITGASVPTGDQCIEFDVRLTSTGGSIYTAPILRSGEGANQQGYQCVFDGTVVQIWKNTAAGVGTLLKTASHVTALPGGATYRMRCEAVNLPDGSVRIYAELGDGIISCHARDLTAPLLSGRPGIKVRGATASTGVRPNAVRVYSTPLRVQSFVGFHDGASWTETTLPAMSNDTFGNGGMVENTDGSFDLLVPSGRAYSYEPWEPAVLKPGGGFPIYVNSGADMDYYTSANGTTWAYVDKAIDRRDVRGQGVQGIVTPHGDGSHPACRGALQLGYSGYLPSDGAPTFTLPYYLVSNRSVDVLKTMRRNMRVPGKITQHFYRNAAQQPYPTALAVPSQSGATWATLDFTGSVPNGCTAVRLRIIPAINQVGTSRLTLNMRCKGVAREQDVELCAPMTPNTDWVWNAWAPLGPDRQLDWTTAVTNFGTPSPQPTVSTVLFQMIGNEIA